MLRAYQNYNVLELVLHKKITTGWFLVCSFFSFVFCTVLYSMTINLNGLLFAVVA